MPTYQYACTACGERSEAVQSFTDAPLTECTACGGTLRKVFSAVGVVFKGSGFYKNDSRAPAKSGGGESKSDSGSGDAGTGKSDSGTTGTGKSDSGTSSTAGGDKPSSAPAPAAASSSTGSTSKSKSA